MISVVINTLNEEKNIKQVIDSVKWADEIIVCDMYSDDRTAEIAKKLEAKVIFHKKTNYVEPARNFAISKANGEWILIVDADEEIPEALAKRLKEIAGKEKQIDFIEIPRKNIIFGKWIQHSGWWPDYQTRFFKKGKVTWQNKIHSKPEKVGLGLTLEQEEKWAIVHRNYQSVGQFVQRLSRYTDVEVQELRKAGYGFNRADLLQKPLEEFLSRFFAAQGYKDGLHGLALSILQAFSFFILYLKLWESEGFKQENVDMINLEKEADKSTQALKYWFSQSSNKNLFKRLFKR